MDKKHLSRQHEDYIARVYEGKRSASSGASIVDKGDVRADDMMFECKMSGEPGSPKRSKLITLMEKVADEAWQEDLNPVLAMRWYCPDSVLADRNGWVDLVVRLLLEDAARG